MNKKITVYHMPGTCSRVTLNALEEIGIDYEDRMVDFARGAQKGNPFLAINPKGKVPVLLSDNIVITETPVILNYLSLEFRSNALLPVSGELANDTRGFSDIVWCASTLHGNAHRVFRPEIYTQGDSGSVKASAVLQLKAHADRVSERLSGGRWWYGQDWSIVDVYLSWIFSVVVSSGFPAEEYLPLSEHRKRVESRASFQRALQREEAALRTRYGL